MLALLLTVNLLTSEVISVQQQGQMRSVCPTYHSIGLFSSDFFSGK